MCGSTERDWLASVRTAASGQAACDSNIVRATATLLQVQPCTGTGQSSKCINEHVQLPVESSRKPRAVRSKPTRSKPEVSLSSLEPLPLKEMAQFATEVANISLRTITQAVRASSGKQGQQTDRTKVGVKRSQLDQSQANRESLRNIANCARLAFLSLLHLCPGSGETQSYQTENGLSSLVSKSITLGLLDVAENALQDLFLRWSPLPEVQKRSDTVDQAYTFLTSALSMRISKLPSQQTSLILSSQVHALRLLLQSLEVPLEPILGTIRLENPCNPISNIRHAFEAGEVMGEDAAKNLMSLAKCLSEASQSQKQPNREEVAKVDLFVNLLEFKLISQDAQQEAWLISSHSCDLVKDILRPLIKVMKNVVDYKDEMKSHQRELIITSAQRQLHRYSYLCENLAKSGTRRELESVQKLIRDISDSTYMHVKGDQAALSSIPKLSTSLTIKNSIEFSARTIADRLRLESTLTKNSSRNLSEFSDSLKQMKNASLIDIEETFLSISTIRRLSYQLLKKNISSGVGKSDIEMNSKRGYLLVLLAVPEFLCYYLNEDISTSPREGGSRIKLEMVNHVVRSTVDALVLTGKFIQHDNDLVRSFLSACGFVLKTISHLEKMLERGDLLQIDESLAKVHLQLSDCAANIYVKRQSSGRLDETNMELLRFSMLCLGDRPIHEMKSGNFWSKAERLVKELETRSLRDEAASVLDGALERSFQQQLIVHNSIGYQGRAGSDSVEVQELSTLEAGFSRLLARRIRLAIAMKKEEIFWHPSGTAQESSLSLSRIVFEFQLEISFELLKQDYRTISVLSPEFSNFIGTDIFRLSDFGDRIRWLSDFLYSSIVLAPSGQRIYFEKYQSSLLGIIPNSEQLNGEQALLVANCNLSIVFLSGEYISTDLRRSFDCLSLAIDQIWSSPEYLRTSRFRRQLEMIETYDRILQIQKLTEQRFYLLHLLEKIYLHLPEQERSRYMAIRLQSVETCLNLGQHDQVKVEIESLLDILKKEDFGTKTLFDAQILHVTCLAKLGKVSLAGDVLGKWVGRIDSLRGKIDQDHRMGKRSDLEMALLDGISMIVYGELNYQKGDMATAVFSLKAGIKTLNQFHQQQKTSPPADGKDNGGCIDENDEKGKLGMGDSKINPLLKKGKQKSILVIDTSLHTLRAFLVLARCLLKLGQASEANNCINQASALAKVIRSTGWMLICDLFKSHFEYLNGTFRRETLPSVSLEANYTPVDLFLLEIILDLCQDSQRAQAHTLTHDLIYHLRRGVLKLLNLRSIPLLASADSSEMEMRCLTSKINQLKLENSNNLATEIEDSSCENFKEDEELRTGYSMPILEHLISQITLERAQIACSKEEFSVAKNILSSLDPKSSEVGPLSRHYEIAAQLLFKDTFRKLSYSPALSTLCEAPLSFPNQDFETDAAYSLAEEAKEHGELNISENTIRANLDFCEARALFEKALFSSYKTQPTYWVHEVSGDLSKVSLLASAISSGTNSFQSPYDVCFGLEIGRNIAWDQFSRLSAKERRTDQLKEMSLKNIFEFDSDNLFDFDADPLSFQERFIDIMPQNWIVISLSISQDKQSLQICRIMPQREPFIISIPLQRQSDEAGNDDFDFDFEYCRNEMCDIVKEANNSTQTTNTSLSKSSRSTWWKSRTALDSRMKNLLVSMDEIWIGGFRGIFATTPVHDKSFRPFIKKFEKILSRYLPSRCSRKRNRREMQVKLHRHVIELFIGLGRPKVDGHLDDFVLDLLGFVIDILQFHGEENARDEIDFDAMMLETIDLLKIYHMHAETALKSYNEGHTILILDKNLHCFPWESMPFMQGASVSRLPSLLAMRNIILRFQKLSPSNFRPECMSIKYNKGVCVLNPSGDLINTESLMQQVLSEVPLGWKNFVREEPPEAQLKDFLEKSDIYLYFGHGSGAQYIRSKTIKQLSKCATTLLLGCSSVTLTEAGYLESYGTPLTYLQAGSPAVLGTLWDVTDKDIDRFSLEFLKRWGLIDGSDTVSQEQKIEPTKANSAGNDVKHEDLDSRATREEISLAEAVASSRELCLMRYLNGAAPVVYGLPIFLDKGK